MKLIGKIKQTNHKLNSIDFCILQALLISKYEYERIYKDFRDNSYALIVDDSLKEQEAEGLLNELEITSDSDDKILSVNTLNYKLSTDFFLFYYFNPSSFKIDYPNLDNEKLKQFLQLVRLLRIEIGYLTNEIVKMNNK